MVKFDIVGSRATITIDEPERRNPLTGTTVRDLLRFTEEANSDRAVRCIVFTGEGDRAFSAGGDLSGGFFDDPIGLHRARGEMAGLFRAMWFGEKVTVGRVNGHALAGGFGLAVACDITVCVDDARLGMPEVGVGLWPMLISVPLLRATSPKVVYELMATGRQLDPSEAQRLGLVSRVVGREDLDATIDRIVEEVSSRSPAATSLGRSTFNSLAGLDADSALDLLQNGLTAVTLSDDAREGLTAFAEKRPPEWSSR
jgi:enoyl-CoA hydratase/carnithine racemase